ncbi:glycosyltransferase [Comamonas composti]|uniref:glycosyltransferase n=1 Tax=Comamonas composti TaxID=408558 RepID=UPI000685F44E|nr:glycosyltransferase [Comamonas composti]
MKMTARKRLVVSGVNLVEGGTLRVFQDFLAAASIELGADWEIIALVHSREKIKPLRAKLIDFSWPKRSWMGRLFFEWVVSKRIAQRLQPDVWFSIHDITPRIGSIRKAVYCHNPMPFYKPSLSEARYDMKLWLFSKLYGYLYGFGIKSNSLVVVQQNWIRKEFEKRYGVDQIMVAYPQSIAVASKESRLQPKSCFQFVFPSLARPFKNFEVICKAVALLEKRDVSEFQVVLTIDLKENKYARDLFLKFGHLKSLRFVGRQNFDEMRAIYSASRCLIFPSRIETWGLPITEAKSYGLDILVADEKYAHETVGCYDKAAFFSTNDENDLAEKMLSLIQGNPVTGKVVVDLPQKPFVQGWGPLVREVIGEKLR